MKKRTISLYFRCQSLYVYDVHAHVMIVLSLYLAKLCSSMSPFPFHSEVHPIAYEH